MNGQSVYTPIVCLRDGSDIGRALNNLNDPRGLAAILPLGFLAQRPFPTQVFGPGSKVFNLQGAAGLVFNNPIGPPPVGKIWLITAFNGEHDDAAARTVNLGVRTTIGGTSIDVGMSQGLALAAGSRIFVSHHFFINAGQSLFVEVPSLAVGAHSFIRAQAYEINLGEDIVTP